MQQLWTKRVIVGDNVLHTGFQSSVDSALDEILYCRINTANRKNLFRVQDFDSTDGGETPPTSLEKLARTVYNWLSSSNCQLIQIFRSKGCSPKTGLLSKFDGTSVIQWNDSSGKKRKTQAVADAQSSGRQLIKLIILINRRNLLTKSSV